eukprot:PhF_6_TR28157/c1_g1_i1/m.41711
MADKAKQAGTIKTVRSQIFIQFNHLENLVPPGTPAPPSTYQYSIRYKRGHTIQGECRTSFCRDGIVTFNDRVELEPCVLPAGAQADPKYKKFIDFSILERQGDKEPRVIGKASMECYYSKGETLKLGLNFERKDLGGAPHNCKLHMNFQIREAGKSDTMGSAGGALNLSQKSQVAFDALSVGSFGSPDEVKKVKKGAAAVPPLAVPAAPKPQIAAAVSMEVPPSADVAPSYDYEDKKLAQQSSSAGGSQYGLPPRTNSGGTAQRSSRAVETTSNVSSQYQQKAVPTLPVPIALKGDNAPVVPKLPLTQASVHGSQAAMSHQGKSANNNNNMASPRSDDDYAEVEIQDDQFNNAYNNNNNTQPLYQQQQQQQQFHQYQQQKMGMMQPPLHLSSQFSGSMLMMSTMSSSSSNNIAPSTPRHELMVAAMQEPIDSLKATMPQLVALKQEAEVRCQQREKEAKSLRQAYDVLAKDVAVVKQELEVCEHREAALAEDIEREKRIKREMEELQREIDAIRRAERSSEQCVCVIS